MDSTEWEVDELTYLLDRRAAAVVATAVDSGGSASMDTLLGATDLGRGELYHLFSDLKRLDLVETRRVPTDRGIETTVVLTPAGQRAVDGGFLDEFDDLPGQDDGARRIWRLSHRLDGLVHR